MAAECVRRRIGSGVDGASFGQITVVVSKRKSTPLVPTRVLCSTDVFRARFKYTPTSLQFAMMLFRITPSACSTLQGMFASKPG